MIRAAASGAIDFAHADLLDPWWWRKVHIILDDLARQRVIEYTRTQFDRIRSLTSRPNLTQESREKLADHSSRVSARLRSLWFPWKGSEDQQDERKTTAQRMYDAWVRIWGDPNDPKVAAAIDQTAASLRAADKGRLQRR